MHGEAWQEMQHQVVKISTSGGEKSDSQSQRKRKKKSWLKSQVCLCPQTENLTPRYIIQDTRYNRDTLSDKSTKNLLFLYFRQDHAKNSIAQLIFYRMTQNIIVLNFEFEQETWLWHCFKSQCIFLHHQIYPKSVLVKYLFMYNCVMSVTGICYSHYTCC